MAVKVTISRPLATTLIVMALGLTGLLVLHIYLSRAVITITPHTETKQVSQTITLSSQVSEPDFVQYTLPAQILEAETTEKKEVQRSGSEITEDYAKGTVTLFNTQSDPQPLLPQTHLRYEETDIFFLTDSPVEIPADGSVEVSVTAKEKGVEGNVDAGTFVIDRLPASMQQVVWAESSDAFTGGEATDSPVTAHDMDSLLNELRETATQKAIGQLTLEAKGASLDPELVTVESLSENVSVPEGSHATSYTAHIHVRARGFLVNKNDLLSLTLLKLRSQVEAGQEFSSYDPASFSISVERSDLHRGTAHIQTHLTGSFTQKIGASVLSKDNLAGLNKQEVIERFMQHEQVGDVSVHFTPFWVSAVPSRTEGIEFSIAK